MMCRNYLKIIIFPLFLLLSCSAIVREATINIYSNPTYWSGQIRRIAIFPLESSQLTVQEARRLDRKIDAAVQQKYPKFKILNTTKTSRLLSKNRLYQDWNHFYKDYLAYGHPEPAGLQRISATLDADAILYCKVLSVNQQDGQYRERTALTTAEVKFSLFETRSGKLIWEASSEGFEENELTFEQAPPVFRATDLAITKILVNLPLL